MDEGGAFLIQIIIGLVLGAIAASVASGKGRSGVGWFFGGFFLGIVGIIIVCCLSNLTEEQSRITRDAEEKRRLREQLRQEQLKAEAYREYTSNRLDAHDDALGLDTRETTGGAPLLTGPSPAMKPRLNLPGAPQPPEPPAADEDLTEWHYVADGDRKGPVSRHEVDQMIAMGAILPDTLVWNENLTDWQPASQNATLRSSFPQTS